MLKTFKAWLKEDRLEWIGDRPNLDEETREVYVTFLDGKPAENTKTRGQQMAKILEDLAAAEELDALDPVLWQQDIRQERSLPGR